MFREFIETNEFQKKWTGLGLSDIDLLELEVFLCKNPQFGDVIARTGGLRKLRWGCKGRGKRGGIRVVYIDFVLYEKIYLITAYAKNEKDNLVESEKKQIKIFIKNLEDELGK